VVRVICVVHEERTGRRPRRRSRRKNSNRNNIAGDTDDDG
jgi:hypothetical protein